MQGVELDGRSFHKKTWSREQRSTRTRNTEVCKKNTQKKNTGIINQNYDGFLENVASGLPNIAFFTLPETNEYRGHYMTPTQTSCTFYRKSLIFVCICIKFHSPPKMGNSMTRGEFTIVFGEFYIREFDYRYEWSGFCAIAPPKDVGALVPWQRSMVVHGWFGKM